MIHIEPMILRQLFLDRVYKRAMLPWWVKSFDCFQKQSFIEISIEYILDTEILWNSEYDTKKRWLTKLFFEFEKTKYSFTRRSKPNVTLLSARAHCKSWRSIGAWQSRRSRERIERIVTIWMNFIWKYALQWMEWHLKMSWEQKQEVIWGWWYCGAIKKDLWRLHEKKMEYSDQCLGRIAWWTRIWYALWYNCTNIWTGMKKFDWIVNMACKNHNSFHLNAIMLNLEHLKNNSGGLYMMLHFIWNDINLFPNTHLNCFRVDINFM